jgi:hypothetical protein
MIVLIYVGMGGFVPGVPARDLDEDDLARLREAGWSEDDLVRTGLYIRQMSDETKRDNAKPNK